ncbi:MAG: hypothetical protein ACNA8G_00375 [Gammaproteobacteria bacterium]
MLARATANGERFTPRDDDPESGRIDLPHPALSLLPLALVLGFALMFHDNLGTSALIVALLAGCFGAALANPRRLR